MELKELSSYIVVCNPGDNVGNSAGPDQIVPTPEALGGVTYLNRNHIKAATHIKNDL